MRKEKRFSALFTCRMPLRPVPNRKTEVRETPAAYPSHKTRPGFDLSLLKRVLNDLTPLPGNDLFITQYWFDKQTDPPLHFHEDYMLSLTLNVKGTRVTGQSVDNFTEKDLIIIFPRVPHCYKRDEAFAETNCEAVAVQFSRDMPNWQIFETESMLPIRKMLSQPVAGLWFAESVVDRVRDRLLQLPGLRGFASASLFLNILNDLATAGPDETGPIGAPYYEMQPDGNARINKIVQFVEGNYQRKISLEDIGEEVGMSATSVCRFFKKYTHQNLWNYLNGFRIVRAAQTIVETDDPIAEIGMRCGFYNISNFNRAFRERIGSPPGDYRRKFGSTVISPDAKQVEEIGRKLDEMRCGQDSAGGGKSGGQSPGQGLTNPFSGTIDVFLDTQSVPPCKQKKRPPQRPLFIVPTSGGD